MRQLVGMSKNMADVGSGFLNVAIDDDQEVSKQNWGAYQEKMAELEKNSGARYVFLIVLIEWLV